MDFFVVGRPGIKLDGLACFKIALLNKKIQHYEFPCLQGRVI